MHNTLTDLRSPRVTYSVYIYMCIIFAKIRGGFCANSRSIQGIKVVSVSVPLYVIRMSGRLIVFRALQDRYFLFLNKFEEELGLDPVQ